MRLSPARRVGLRVSAAILVAGVVLPGVGTAAASELSAHTVRQRVMEDQEQTASAAAGSLTVVLADRLHWVQATADRRDVADLIDHHNPTTDLSLAGYPPACRWVASSDITGIVAIEQTPTAGCPTDASLLDPLTVDRPAVLQASVAAAGGTGLDVVAAPVYNAGGRRVGSIEAIFPVAQMLSDLTFGRTGSLTVVDRSGLVLAAPQPQLVGNRVKSTLARHLAAAGTVAAGQTWAPTIHQELFFAYAPSSGGIGVLAGIDTGEALASMTSLQHRMWAAGVAVALIAIAFAAVIGKRFADRERRMEASDASRRQVEGEFRRSFEESPIGMAQTDMTGRYTMVNSAFARMLGTEPADLIARSIVDVTHPEDRAEAQRAVDDAAGGRLDRYQADKRYLRSDGESVWVEVSAVVICGPDGAAHHMLCYVVDIGERIRKTAELRVRAQTDPLTGVSNRSTIIAELQRVARANDHVGVLFIDLDGFKDINDTLGHDAGDEVLVGMAARIQNSVRPSDVVGRVGGDEFIVVCPDPSPATLDQIATRLHEAVSAPFHLRGETLVLGASIGSAWSGGDAEAADLIKRADADMYRAKRTRVGASRPQVQPEASAPT